MSEAQENNKALVRRFLKELAEKGNFDVMDELLAEGFVNRNPTPGQGPTREDYKRSVEEILRTSLSPTSPSRSRSPKVTRSSPSTPRAASLGASSSA